MLHKLLIRNYALIDNLDISFSEELNIVTGETGAGKSIILGALSLILGQRLEGKYFFNQQKKCVIEGVFQLEGYNLEPFFLISDLDYSKETILRREISPDGKSRAFINDTPVNLALLKQLGERLIDIHSQHATLEINNPEFQLLVVDSLANHEDLLSNYKQLYKRFQQITSELSKFIENSIQAAADLNYYQFQFDELEVANLKVDEQESLETELNALNHAEEIKRGLVGAYYKISEAEESSITTLKDGLTFIEQSEKHYPLLAPIVERLRSTLIEIKDIAEEISQTEQGIVFNEKRLQEINERINVIYTLQKKHRVNAIQELLEIQKGLSDKLNSILTTDEDIEKLKIEQDTILKDLYQLALQISANRLNVFSYLEDQVQNLLMEVGMPSAILKVNNEVAGKEQLTINGIDKIQFLFSANKGQSVAPMSKSASGGELSRIMLCVKSLIAKHTALPTIIFDEIDTGISGEVAAKVGGIMEKLAKNLQVIAITHLPQIASKGDAHYWVFKDEQDEITRTNIKKLSSSERELEIAKMLSGQNPGEFAFQNARELLK
ncbi:MAG: recN [Sphingobacteriales bacterium]|nr:recN [Sphingobacteriales bacterium]